MCMTTKKQALEALKMIEETGVAYDKPVATLRSYIEHPPLADGDRELMHRANDLLDVGLEYVAEQLTERKRLYAGYPNLAHKYAAEQRDQDEFRDCIAPLRFRLSTADKKEPT